MSGFRHTLGDVVQAYPQGIPPQASIWIWRRILEVLSFIHNSGMVHGAVLPLHLLVQENEHGMGRTYRQRQAQSDATWDRGQGHAPIIEPEFKAGQNVRHPTWGEGMVLDARIEDGEEIVDVHFEDIGMKKLVASLARLEVVD